VRIFRNESSTPLAMAQRIHDEGAQWIDNSFSTLASFWKSIGGVGLVAQSTAV